MTPETLVPPFGLVKDPWGRLTLIDAEGVRHENVRPVRTFPFSDPEHWISLRDERSRELVCIEDPQRLPDAVRQTLLSELALRDFVPRIRKIQRIHRTSPGHDWHVETDRGPTVMHLESEDSIHSLGNGRLLLIDVHNVRYLIPDVAALDRASRRRLERYY